MNGPGRRLTIGLSVVGLFALVFVIAFFVGRGASAPDAPAPDGALEPPATGALVPPGDSAGPNTSAAPKAPLSAATEAAADPTDAATGWLRTSRGLDWTDPTPTTWTSRVRSYATDVLMASYSQTNSTGPGVGWDQFVQARCSTRVLNAGASVPSEAPRTNTSVYVQVSGQVVTTCLDGPAPSPGNEDASATVEVRRGTDGAWRVNHQLF